MGKIPFVYTAICPVSFDSSASVSSIVTHMFDLLMFLVKVSGSGTLVSIDYLYFSGCSFGRSPFHSMSTPYSDPRFIDEGKFIFYIFIRISPFPF